MLQMHPASLSLLDEGDPFPKHPCDSSGIPVAALRVQVAICAGYMASRIS